MVHVSVSLEGVRFDVERCLENLSPYVNTLVPNGIEEDLPLECKVEQVMNGMFLLSSHPISIHPHSHPKAPSSQLENGAPRLEYLLPHK